MIDDRDAFHETLLTKCTWVKRVGPMLLPFSPCGRRWREAPDEGSLSANSSERCLRGDNPSPGFAFAKPPSPTGGEGLENRTVADHLERRRAIGAARKGNGAARGPGAAFENARERQ